MVSLKKALVAALVLPGVSAVSPAKPLLALRQAKSKGGPEEPEEPADSETVEGADCGHVKQIIGKWTHSKKVGQYAGAARSAITEAEKASGLTDKAIERAEAVGEELTEDGKVPKRIEGPADEARSLSEKAVKNAMSLDTKLGTFKDTASGSEFSGEDVSSEDLSELKKLTTKTVKSARDADDAAARVEQKAKEYKKDALGNADKALKMMKMVLKEGEPTLEEGKKIEQKVGWAKDKADIKIEDGEAMVQKVEKKAKDKDTEEQKPIFDSLAEEIQGKVDGLKDSKESLNTAIGEMETANSELEDALEPIKGASEKGDGGDTSSVLADAGKVPPAEEKIDDAKGAISKVKERAKTMMKRMDRVDEIVEKAEKKIK